MRLHCLLVAKFIDTSVTAALTKRKLNLSLRKLTDLEGTPLPSVETSVQTTSRRRSSALQSPSMESSTTLTIMVCKHSPQVFIRDLRTLMVAFSWFPIRQNASHSSRWCLGYHSEDPHVRSVQAHPRRCPLYAHQGLCLFLVFMDPLWCSRRAGVTRRTDPSLTSLRPLAFTGVLYRATMLL